MHYSPWGRTELDMTEETEHAHTLIGYFEQKRKTIKKVFILILNRTGTYSILFKNTGHLCASMLSWFS